MNDGEDESRALAEDLASTFESLPAAPKQSLNVLEAYWQEIFEPFPFEYGRQLSRFEREQYGYTSTTLAYGEITFRVRCLTKCRVGKTIDCL